MQCGRCRSGNDADALFCEQCGSALLEGRVKREAWQRRPYTAAVLLIIAAVIALGTGYYRFILPRGVAAVVNGEKILLAEVDHVVQSTVPGGEVPPEAAGRMRYAVLSRLITERIAEQEARKAGLRIPTEELMAAMNRAQAASGMDRDRYESAVADRYGSMQDFRRALERQLVVKKFISERLAPGLSDPTIIDGRVERWLQEASTRAVVRISLEEQLPAGGCGGCDRTSEAGPRTRGCEPSRRTEQGASLQAVEARKAALAYWRERHGDVPVEARVTDFGCHQQIDMMQGTRTAKSLRYQNGRMTEL